MSIQTFGRRIQLDWRSLLLCVVAVLVSHKSEAFANSFRPSPVRGGSTTRKHVLANPNRNGVKIGPHNGVAPNNNNNYNKKNGSSSSTPSTSNTNGQHADHSDEPVTVKFIAETALPSDLGFDLRLRGYRTERLPRNQFTGNEPCVIYSTDKPPFGTDGNFKEGVPVRIHDQCLTSEVFGSRRCDCKEQLLLSLEYISVHGGAVVYLQQEGRGIGLANKIAAYALQDAGMDTVDANLHLGFPEDIRQYGVIPSILKDMKIKSIQLMTNNPRKVDRLTSLGVKVENTIPMVVKRANKHNLLYLETKQRRMNHKNFGEMLNRGLQPQATNGGIVFEPTTSRPTSLAETILNLRDIGGTTVEVEVEDNHPMDGVTAREDGYCFGRQSVEDAIEAIARGDMVCVVDDMNRENEGDLIMAADLCTPEMMAKIIRYTSGVICIAMEGDRMDELELPPMLVNNEDPKGTAFSVTVDAVKENGITTGISARDRSTTVRLLANPQTNSKDFSRPGHIFPLRARSGGVLERDGHTEATVDLARLAGRSPCGVLCEIVSEDEPTEMARLPELIKFCKKHDMVLTSIVDLQQYRRDTEQ